LALVIGIPLGMLWAVTLARGYLGAAPVRLHLHLASVGIETAVPLIALVLTVYLGLFSAVRRLVRSDLWCSTFAIAAPLSPLALVAAWHINRHYLPGRFELESILGNAVMAAAALLACFAASVGLLRWRRARIGRGRPRVLTPLFLVGFVLLIHTGLWATRRTQPRPNVIVLLIDALRADRLGVHGYDRPTSANIDDLAADGVVFTQAISASTFTKTSVASLFTGLDPHHHGVYQGWEGLETDLLRADVTTLAEALRESGVFTVAWIENAQISGFMGFDQGFGRYNHRGEGTAMSERRWWGIKGVNKEFLSWVSRLGKHAPFFAYIHYLDLHGPNLPPEPFDVVYGVHSDLQARIGLDRDTWGTITGRVERGELKLSAADVDQLNAFYDGMLTYLDGEVGALLKALKEMGVYENTLILLTSDHGEGFMEHGLISHSSAPYDELIRVPLIVKLPGSESSGARVDRQVRLIDVAPTILDYLDVAAPAGMDGVSLRPLIENGGLEPVPPSHAFAEFGGTMAVRTEEWKLIEFPGGRWEFYDLVNDPEERHDLAASSPPEAVELREIGRSAAAQRARITAPKSMMDEKTIKSLRALGYVQ
jgi:arylsulfatase A-like enzyme